MKELNEVMKELNEGDIIEWIPENGSLCGRKLTCQVVKIFNVFHPVNLQPLIRVIIEFEVDGKKEQMALPLDAEYKIISQEE